MKRLPLVLLGLLAALFSPAATAVTAAPESDDGPRVVLVTLDGMRWQEVFRGPDRAIVDDAKFTQPDWKESVEASWMKVPDPAEALMPFLHDAIAKQGVLYGNRDRAECAEVTNDMWFSYPGYNEIMTGKADDDIISNDKNYNRNVTVLEWLNHQPGFAGRVAAVGNWDVFPYIINDKRSGVPVNRGFAGRYPTETLTARFGLEALKDDPRFLFVGFGDTDEYGHLGDYYDYLAAANRADDFLRALWTALQTDPRYRGRTTLIVTTDHGRGRDERSWIEHSSKRYLDMFPDYFPAYNKTGITGSNEIWIAAIGPGVRPGALPNRGRCAHQNQIAAGALTALGFDWRRFDPTAGAPLPFLAGR